MADPVPAAMGGTGRRVGALHLLVVSTFVDSLGDGVARIAFSLLALRLTSSPLLVSGVLFANALPSLTVGLFLGALVDRVDRRRLVVTIDACRAALLCLGTVLVVLHALDIWGVYAVVFVIGAGDTATNAVANAVVPRLVKGKALAGANGQVQTASTLGQSFIGPSVAGFVYSVAASLPFAADALSFVASALLLSHVVPPGAAHDGSARPRLSTQISAGLRWLARQRAVRALTVTIFSLAFCQAMVFGVLVVYCERVLHLGARGYGLVIGISSIGDVLGSVTARWSHDRAGPVVAIIGSGLTCAATYLLLGRASSTLAVIVLLALEAVAVNTGVVSLTSLRQRLIPDERFGTTVAAMRLFTAGLAPLGALVGGGLAAAYGTRLTFVVAGALQIALLALAGPALQRGVATAQLGREHQPSPEGSA